MLEGYTITMPRAKDTAVRALRWSEQYMKTDMVYLFQASFWNNINSFFISLFSLGLYILYAHFLSKESYGTYQYLLSFFSIATAFTLTGMNTSVARAIAQGYDGTLRASIPIQIKYGSIPFLGAIGFAVYYYVGGNHLIAMGLVVIGVLTPLLYAYNSYNSYFIGKKDFRSATIYSTSSNVFYYGALGLAAILSGSPLILLGINLGVQTLLHVVFYRIMLRRERLNDRVDAQALAYGMHLSAMGAFGSVAAQVGSIFIFHFLGAVPLALYSFAGSVPDRLGNLFFKFLGSALLPKYAERTIHEIRSTMFSKMGWAFLAGSVIALCYVALAPFFFAIFFPTYMQAVPYSMLCAIGLALAAPLYLPTTALAALQNTRGLYIYNIVMPIVQIVFLLIGIFTFGLWGYIIAHLLNTVVAIILSTFLVVTLES